MREQRAEQSNGRRRGRRESDGVAQAQALKAALAVSHKRDDDGVRHAHTRLQINLRQRARKEAGLPRGEFAVRSRAKRAGAASCASSEPQSQSHLAHVHEQLSTRSHDSMQHEGAARKARAHGLRLQLGRLFFVSVATSKSVQRGASVCASASARAPGRAEAAARLRSGFSVARRRGGKLGGRRDARCRVGDASRRVRVAERDGDIAPTEAAQRQALQLAALGQHGSHALGG